MGWWLRSRGCTTVATCSRSSGCRNYRRHRGHLWCEGASVRTLWVRAAACLYFRRESHWIWWCVVISLSGLALDWDKLDRKEPYLKSQVRNHIMPRSEIPVDVLRDILDHVDKEDLATMCRVNKICCYCSQNVLYRNIRVNTPKVQQTLAQSTKPARRVLPFELRCSDPYLAMALRNMTSLSRLKLWSAIDADILDGCTFKLDSFDCASLKLYGECFQNFLSSQPNLKCVNLPPFFDYTMSPLEATCLPNLTRINARFPWLPYLIPGRPLNEVISNGCTSYEHPIDLSFFTLSTAPIQKLGIDYSYLHPTPLHLLASFLPSLTHFTLTVGERVPFFRSEGYVDFPILIFGYWTTWHSLDSKFPIGLKICSLPLPHSEFLHFNLMVIIFGTKTIPDISQKCSIGLITLNPLLYHGSNRTFRCKSVNENYVVCGDAEYPPPWGMSHTSWSRLYTPTS
jgi:hypothetical protein